MTATAGPAGATDVRAVAMSYFEELTNKRNVDFVDQLFTPDIAFHDPARLPNGQARGIAEVKQFFTIFFKVFPDLHFGIDDFFCEDNKVAIRFTWTGTYRKKFLGITWKKRHVSVPGIDIFHLRGDRICEVRVAFDRLTLIQQLGGIRNPF